MLHLQLASIILHRGSSTLSGRYVCLTQRESLWYACNDDCVKRVEGPNQWLLNNDDFTPYMYMFQTTIQDLNNAHPGAQGIQTHLYEMAYKEEGVVNQYTTTPCMQLTKCPTRVGNGYMIAH